MQITKIVENTYKNNEQHLDYFTYPCISDQFDELFVWERSVLYLKSPLYDMD